MMEVIGVRFKKAGKIYFFDACGQKVERGEDVIVETARGVEFGTVVQENTPSKQQNTGEPLKKLVRIATDQDRLKETQNRQKELEAFAICEEKIRRRKLDMRLVRTEYTFDHNKLIFYFTSDDRVDFRELVKELAAVFHTRIELRQIGVRDEAKLLNGMGICGRPLCCANFLEDFQPVSIKMAKEQNLSLNPNKISGVCGRLLCCLKYEEEAYEELKKGLPSLGDIVETKDGSGEILSISVVTQTIKAAVRKKENDPPYIGFYKMGEFTVIRKRRRRGKQNSDPNDEGSADA